MAINERIQKMLFEMGPDYSKNVEIINNLFDCSGLFMNDALFTLTDELYSEEACLLAINSLLSIGKLDPNLKNVYNHNFIDNAIDSGYSGDFIFKLVKMATDERQSSILLDVNGVDDKGRTILHNILYGENYKNDVTKIFRLLISKDFDCSIKDKYGRNVFFALIDSEVNGVKHENVGEFKFIFDEWVASNYRELEDIPLCRDEIGFEEGIDQLLSELSGDVKKDYLYLFHSGDYLKHTVSQLCRALVSLKVEPKKVIYAFKAVLNDGYSMDNFVDNDGNNIIQLALRAGYDGDFIREFINAILESEKGEKFNINYVNKKGESMLHSAIYFSKYKGDISRLYEFFLEKGFDSDITDENGRNIVGAMSYMMGTYKKYTDKDISEVVEVMSNSSLYAKKENEEIMKATIDSNEKFIEKILDQMSGDFDRNKEIIEEVCLTRKDWNYNDLLYILTVELRDEKKCFCALKTLLSKMHVNPNYTPLNGQNNFIQNAINCGYSERFVSMIISESVFPFTDRNLNINYKNHKGENIFHSAVKSENYKGSIFSFYKKLVGYKFDSRMLDVEGLDLMGVLEKEQKKSGKFSVEEMDKIREFYNEQIRIHSNYERFKQIIEKGTLKKDDEDSKKDDELIVFEGQVKDERRRLTPKEICELEEHGTILNYKNFISEPVIGREKEMESLMVSLAQDKKSPIIVGESGVGKSALVYELAYLIKNDMVPKFLRDKIIYEVSPGDLVAGCSYVGQFEAKMKEMFAVARKYEVILFIDEIHTMYGVGTSEKKKTGMEEHVKHFLDRNDNVKLIGTTTEEEYSKFMAGDALKRRFEKISVKEPDEIMLRKIIDKVIDDYCLKAKISFENENDKVEIVKVIMEATYKSHRVYNDRVNNPDLAISIIDKAFAFAKYFDCEKIGKDHFVKAFEHCDRIYESAANSAISKLKNKVDKPISDEEKSAKILKVDFTKFRR